MHGVDRGRSHLEQLGRVPDQGSEDADVFCESGPANSAITERLRPELAMTSAP